MIACRPVLRRGVLAGMGALVLSAPAAIGALDDIVERTLMAHTIFLASPAMGGRAAASLEGRIAANYIASHFERLGLRAIGDTGSFFQNFDVHRGWVDVDATSLSARIADTNVAFALGRDFGFPQQGLHGTDAQGPLVSTGFAVHAPEFDYDDFEGIDVAGRIVLAFTHEPQEREPASRFKGRWHTVHAYHWRKIEQVRRAGAAGLLLIDEPPHREPLLRESAADAQPTPSFALAETVRDLPVFVITPRAADVLLGPSGRTSQQIREALDRSGRPGSFAVPNVTVIMRKRLTDRESLPARNVVALLEGADPALRHQYVIVSAHYDHLGTVGDTVLPGADDNASGVAALLEIARALSEGPRPRRGVLFVAFDAEERGLLGSFHYVSHPVVPLEQTVAVLNLDMIGRNEDTPAWPTQAGRTRDAVNIVGTLYSPDVRRAIESSNGTVGLALDFKTDGDDREEWFARSDHFPFADRSVPAVLFNTGEHADYHSERDTADAIDSAKQARIARLALATARQLANDDRRPAFVAR